MVQYLWLIPALPLLVAGVTALMKQPQRQFAARAAIVSMGLAETLSPQEIFATKAFQGLSEFDQARILFRLEEKAQEQGSGLSKSKLIEQFHMDPVARKVYRRFLGLPPWW